MSSMARSSVPTSKTPPLSAQPGDWQLQRIRGARSASVEKQSPILVDVVGRIPLLRRVSSDGNWARYPRGHLGNRGVFAFA